jgi:hypothetical protein
MIELPEGEVADMRLLLLSMVCVLVTLPSTAFSQCEHSLYGVLVRGSEFDEDCWKYEPAGESIFTVVVWYNSMGEGVAQAQFRLVPSSGFTGVYLDETHHGIFALGNSQDGISIFMGCGGYVPGTASAFGEVDLLEVRYMTFGTSASCSYLRVEACPGGDPTGVYEPGLLVWTCAVYAQCYEAGGGKLYVNPNMGGGVECMEQCYGGTIPAHETTWGQIKELYKE